MKLTEKDLVDFGNRLLSKERNKNLRNKVNKNFVNDSDIENFLETKRNK